MSDPLVGPIDKSVLQNCNTLVKVSDLPLPADRYIMEPKFDGFRLIVRHELDGSISVFTRNGKVQNGKLPKIEALIRECTRPGTVLDGEVAAPYWDETLKVFVQDFEQVQSIMLSKPERAVRQAAATRDLEFYVFDCLAWDGKDLRNDPLSYRRETATLAVGPYGDLVQMALALPATQETYEAECDLGFEGVVVKQADAKYASGKRGHGWFKMKRQVEVDAVIIGYKPGSKRNEGKIGGVIFGQHSPPKEFKKGSDYFELEIDGVLYVSRGSFGALADKHRDELTADPDAFIGQAISVKHMGAMAGGRKFRHPEWGRTRHDKLASECGWDDG